MPVQWHPKTIQFDPKLWKSLEKEHALEQGKPSMNAFIRELLNESVRRRQVERAAAAWKGDDK